MFSNTVETMTGPSESTQMRQVVGYVLYINLVGIGAEEMELASTVKAYPRVHIN